MQATIKIARDHISNACDHISNACDHISNACDHISNACDHSHLTLIEPDIVCFISFVITYISYKRLIFFRSHSTNNHPED